MSQRKERALYVPKGEQREENPEQEQKKQERQEKKQQKRQQRQEKYNYDKSQITLETEIPELPKKHEIVQKPKREDLDKKLDDVDKQIDKMHEHLHRYIDEVKKTMKGLNDKKDAIPLQEVLREKVAQRKELKKEFDKIKEDFDKQRDKINELFDVNSTLRQKMKHLDRPEDIMKTLKQAKDRQANEQLTPSQEKQLCKQIADLEKSLPYAQPLEENERKMELARAEKKRIGTLMNEVYSKIKKLNEEIDEYKGDLDNMMKNKEETQKQLDPAIQTKKEEFKEQIEKLKKKKKDMIEQYHEQYDKYDDQQDFIRHTEWMQRQKQKLVKDEKRRKEDEDKKKREEARAKRLAQQDLTEKEKEELEKNKPKENPFLDHIGKQKDLCAQLIVYCESLLPQKDQKSEQKQQEQVDIQQALKSAEWSKEKVTVMKSKEEKEDFYSYQASGNNKKRKGQKKQGQGQKQETKQQAENPKQLFNHNLDTIQQFESVKVATPMYAVELEKTIQLLKEKKTYFENPPEEAILKNEEEEKEGKEEKKEKKDKKKQQQLNEEEFPSF